MRYKFRAWDENNEVMEYGVSVDNGRPVKKGYQLYHTGNTVYHSQPMQFTGLTDVNGVEIYEGDILSTDLDRPYLIVEFRNGAFMFQCHDNGKDYYDFMATTGENYNFTKYHEVIGNIYQHKHLLKENN